MTHRRAFEALDRSLRDIQSVVFPEAPSLPFGGKVVVLGGDPRQILPVIENGTREQIVDAAILNSKLWSHVTILELSQNMRLSRPGCDSDTHRSIASFSKWILDVGEGKIEATAREGETEPSWIKIPHDILLLTHEDKLTCIVNTIYPDLQGNYLDETYIQEREILYMSNK